MKRLSREKRGEKMTNKFLIPLVLTLFSAFLLFSLAAGARPLEVSLRSENDKGEAMKSVGFDGKYGMLPRGVPIPPSGPSSDPPPPPKDIIIPHSGSST